jgi:hypothetical protein
MRNDHDRQLCETWRQAAFAVGLHGSELEKKEVYLDLDWPIKEKERW